LIPISVLRSAGAAEGARRDPNSKSIAPVSDYAAHRSAADSSNDRGEPQSPNRTSFFGELKRRNVHKVGVAYIVAGWALAQGIAQVFPVFGAPNWAIRLLFILIILGFPVAAGFAWLFELTPEGIKRTAVADAANQHSHGRAWIYVITVGAVFLSGLFFVGRYTAHHLVLRISPSPEAVRSDKEYKRRGSTPMSAQSIAVLPFENLSSDQGNAFFAEGIQDEILTRLAKIGALKVISRTSTAHLAHTPKNLPGIARQLGVANILEGSVQKAGDTVHVNVQLIRAVTDEHIWAESYDRKLDDIFGVEKEIAQNIASVLNAKLTGGEDADLAQKPTNNAWAYAAYLRGNTQLWRANEQSLLDAAQSYEQAVRRDPQFAFAWAALARAHSVIYYVNDTTPARAAMAQRAIVEADRLQPQAPETQLARGYFNELVLHDYKTTADLMKQAHRTWPGNFEILQLLAFATARLGEWQESADAWDAAIALNPRDLLMRFWAAQIPMNSRDFATADRIIEEGLEVDPNDQRLLAAKAEILQALGQLDQAQLIVSRLNPQPADFEVNAAIWYQAKLRRNSSSALELFQRLSQPTERGHDWLVNRFYYGELQNLSGDKIGARASFTKVRDEANAGLQKQPDNARLGLCAIEAAIALSERDSVLRLIEQRSGAIRGDQRRHLETEELRARMLAKSGIKGAGDEAIPLLELLLEEPYNSPWTHVPLTPALLRLDPDFDSLRGNARFQKLCRQ
jgi:TolB-like protein/cytochrome c-type biogenesis protein CcmH/NrfG